VPVEGVHEGMENLEEKREKEQIAVLPPVKVQIRPFILFHAGDKADDAGHRPRKSMLAGNRAGYTADFLVEPQTLLGKMTGNTGVPDKGADRPFF
jgi:hypothetical protein